MKNVGYTLVELLVVIAILAGVGSIIGVILSTSLRGTSKTATITTLQQSGSYGITQLQKAINNASVWTTSMEGKSHIDGMSIISDDTNPDWNKNANWVQYCQDSTKYSSLAITSSVDNLQTTFTCQNDSYGKLNIASISANPKTYLFDTTTIAVPTPPPTACYFTCAQFSLTSPPTIGINFTLQQANSSAFVEKVTPPIIFHTTIVMRNY